MIKATSLFAIVLIAGSTMVPVSAVHATEVRPVAEIRTLSRIQNGLAQGQTSGLRVQRIVIRSMGHKFLSAPPEIWSDPQNADAAIRFLLSGGDPAFGQIRIVQDAIPKSRQRIFAAAMAFANGSRSKARRLLNGIEPRALPPLIAGHVSLVAGILLSRQDPGAAQRYLEDARLLGSGTLIEEAALRRQISVAVAGKEFASFRSLSETYVLHYKNSVYLGVFRERFSKNVLSVLDAGNKNHIAWLIQHLKRYKPQDRVIYSILISKEAVLRGRTDVVAALAKLGLDDVEVPADMSSQLALYKSATSIFGKDADDGAKLLSLVDVEHLERSDIAIHHAATFLLGRIRDWPKGEAPKTLSAQNVTKPGRSEADDAEMVAMLLKSGQSKLATATKLLAQ